MAAARAALDEVEAGHLADRGVADMSGGERARVLLARALAVEADVLLMDEPLSHLDPPHQADWLQIVRELVAAGRTVVSVLHELNVALMADRLVVMQQGRVLHHGPCDDPLCHDAVREVFEQRVRLHQLDGQWVALPVL